VVVAAFERVSFSPCGRRWSADADRMRGIAKQALRFLHLIFRLKSSLRETPHPTFANAKATFSREGRRIGVG
jgi:hypothetical protein